MRAFHDNFTQSSSIGKFWVDAFPILNYLPSALAPWKRWGRQLFDTQDKLFTRHMRDVKRRLLLDRTRTA